MTDLLHIVKRLADGERSDEGHTALREAAQAALATQPLTAPVEREQIAWWEGQMQLAMAKIEQLQALVDSRPSAATEDVRWAVNYLLEQIAAKFEAWGTLDLFRSEAAATVRSFKHDLSSVPPQTAPILAEPLTTLVLDPMNPTAGDPKL